jgi:hypothetical protein
LLTGMSGISLHMQWPLTSQLHGSVSQREQLFFFVTDQTPSPYPTRSLPAQFQSWTFFKLPPYTLAGFDLTTHSSSLLGCRRRRYH